MTKTYIGLVTLLGFSDEFRKIGSSLPEMQKIVNKSVSRPGKISKSPKPAAPEPSPDYTSSIKTNPPPPITAGGF